MKKVVSMLLAVGMTAGMLAGTAVLDVSAADKKTFVFGDTTFNAENEEADVNPHNTYAGWACIRYGVGETLFKYSDSMEVEPWLATDYENIDENTWKINLRDDVYFSNGTYMDGEAVKSCLEDLVAVHDRAAG
ncbi:MAG: ABC transporter substrate-binding protein, partial [Blautia sp.]|nr:ABC transporter substrate-binding protein [Blautia sp.]